MREQFLEICSLIFFNFGHISTDLNSIKNIRLLGVSEGSETVSFTHNLSDNCLKISTLFHKTLVLKEFGFEIEFDFPVVAWRNHDYTWVDCNNDRIANYFSPKILKLKDGTKVVAGSTEGIWHYKRGEVNKLYWNLVEPGLSPLFQYGESGIRNFLQIGREFNGTLNLKLFITKNEVMEWSRSIIPFSGILCFTDHCDFDTLTLLKRQRELFRANNIRVTKGFFQYHFSKREDNPSFEKPEEQEEYLNWLKDGHELAYHSLSQSKKKGNEPFDDFNKFRLKDAEVVTWIDHGYQPYNFTMIEANSDHINFQGWIRHIKNKGIKYLWNYLDSGESAIGVINQISPESFHYQKAFSGKKNLLFLNKISERIRIFLFYYTNEKTLLKYRTLSSQIKAFKSKKHLKKLLHIISLLIILSRKIISALLPGKRAKVAIPDFATDSPCIFKIYQGTEDEITLFQTIAVKDFVNTFSSKNLEELSKEGGLCIAHTYFSFLEAHHHGKMFLNKNGDISDEINDVIQNIGNYNKSNKVWNPTFKELAEHFETLKDIEYEFDETLNELRIKSKPETAKIPVRVI